MSINGNVPTKLGENICILILILEYPEIESIDSHSFLLQKFKTNKAKNSIWAICKPLTSKPLDRHQNEDTQLHKHSIGCVVVDLQRTSLFMDQIY